jgi:hypothetical protein
MKDPLHVRTAHGDHSAKRFLLIAFALLGGVAGSARADESLLQYAMSVPREGEADTLRFAAFQVERYDSNFFRLPDGVSPGGNGRRSVVTSTTGFGIGLEKRYGLQRIVIDAAVTRDQYAPYKDLDFTGERLTSTYYWSMTPDITGNLVFDHARLPTDYEYTGFSTRNNPRTTQLARFDVDWRAGAALHPRLSVYTNEDTTDDPTFQLQSSKARNAEAALIYEFRSANSAQIYIRGARGENTGSEGSAILLINNDFTEGEAGVRTSWNVNGVTNGVVSIGRLQRNYSTFNQRDFNGLVGSVEAKYTLTGKSSANLSATRTLNSSQTTFSSYYVEDYARVNLDYAATGKIIVRPIFKIRRQVYRGSPFPVASPLIETTRDTALEVQYMASRSLDFALALTRSTRTSTDSTLTFVDRSASLSARIRF